MDAIGLGDYFANVVIISALMASLVGMFFFRNNRKALLAWLSCSLNAISFLYFLGAVSYLISIFNIVVWPLINLALIIRYVRTRKK